MIKKLLIFITIIILTSQSMGVLATNHDVKVINADKPKSDFTRNCVEGENEYCLLEPIGTEGGENFEKFTGSQGLADYLNIGIKIFLGVVATLSVIMIVLGGIQYMTTDAYSKKEGGKEMITHSIGGLLLALASVLLLQTINPQLLQVEVDLPTVDVTALSVDQPGDLERVTVTVNGQSVSYDTKCNQASIDYASKNGFKLETGSPFPPNDAAKTEEKAIIAELAKADISWTSTNGGTLCTAVGQTGCTSFYGTPKNGINKLIEFKNACVAFDKTCKIVISGATECWPHQSHGPGLDRFDILPNSGLQKYITSNNFNKEAPIPGWGQPYTKGSMRVVAEPSVEKITHWHVHNW
jgi:hypothetical protein